ncbi:MAG: DUF1223 domain-containing protein [Rhodobacteraceae bacterium]|nr:DUF1223 domain-containing protein [Paracoccaceae bacterium]
MRHGAALALCLGVLLPGSGQADPVVVELFTSQGCSACPPADELLGELAGRTDVLPLALHVDYWDYIGWADTFALPVFTTRQKNYAHAAGRSMIYTPQMIVDGTWDIPGYKPAKVFDAIDRAADRPDLVRIELSASDGRLEIRIVPETPIPGGGQVILTRFIPHARVDIERGENAGQILDYVNIVSEWHNLGHWDGSGPAEIDTDLDGDEPGAVLVQAEGFGPVLAAERLP